MRSTGSPSRQVRALRGTVVASVTTAVALASHVAGGGHVPGWLGIVTPWALSLWLSTLLAGRRVRRWRTVASVAVGQTLFHTLFVLGTPTGPHSPTGAPLPTGPHADHALPAPTAPSSATVDLLVADAQMWAWHTAAAVATIALLYRGELYLLRLRRTASAVAVQVTGRVATRWADVAAAPPLEIPAAPATHPDRYHPPVRSHPELRPLQRRGPPALSAL